MEFRDGEIVKGVNCYDQATLESPEKTPEGFLLADSFLTRSGLFQYQTNKGPIVQFRSELEVFRMDSLATLKMKPVTDDHPSESGRRVLLDTDNVEKFSKGHIGENIVQVGDKVRAKIMITDKALAAAVLAGRNQLSCGYICDLRFEKGEVGGQQYDAVQSNIQYNHVSVVSEGRAGANVAMRIDSFDGDIVMDFQPTNVEGKPHVTYTHLVRPRI